MKITLTVSENGSHGYFDYQNIFFPLFYPGKKSHLFLRFQDNK